MPKVYEITACRLVKIEIVADSGDDACEQALSVALDDWQDSSFEILDYDCVSSDVNDHFGPDRHGE